LEGRLDLRRVSFVGWLAYQQYLAVLQLSSAHVYLTYPFVLSWSLLEAMAAGCVVIGSRTPPVEEAIDGTSNGYLVDFFDADALAERICSVLRDPAATAPIRAQARAHVLANYDLKTVCLPAHLELIRQLTGQPAAPGGAAPRQRRKSPARQRRKSAARQPVSA